MQLTLFCIYCLEERKMMWNTYTLINYYIYNTLYENRFIGVPTKDVGCVLVAKNVEDDGYINYTTRFNKF